MKFLRYASAVSFLLGAFSFAPLTVLAIETEQYLQSTSGPLPNVLFLIDTSKSLIGDEKLKSPSTVADGLHPNIITDDPTYGTKLFELKFALKRLLEGENGEGLQARVGMLAFPPTPFGIANENVIEGTAREDYGAQTEEDSPVGESNGVELMFEFKTAATSQYQIFGQINRGLNVQSKDELGVTTPIVQAIESAIKYYEGSLRLNSSTPMLESPIQNWCQKNHIVLLTEGEPTDWQQADRTISNSGKEEFSFRGKTCKSWPLGVRIEGSYRGRCGEEMTSWANTADLLTGDDERTKGEQTINTHTIVFSDADEEHTSATQWLDSLTQTEEDGKKQYRAKNAKHLIKIFESIVGGAVINPAPMYSLTYPSDLATGRAIYKEDSSGLVYSPVVMRTFKPSVYDMWRGNLKRFRMYATVQQDDDGQYHNPTVRYVDEEGKNIFNENGEIIEDKVREYFAQDLGRKEARNPLDGGVGLNVFVSNSRDVYGNLSSLEGGPASTDLETEDSEDIDDENSRSNNGNPKNKLKNRMKWFSGKGRNPYKSMYLDAQSAEEKDKALEDGYAIGAPLHGEPLFIQYRQYGDDPNTDKPKAVLVQNTTQGMVHVFDFDSGEEKVAFILSDFIDNIEHQLSLNKLDMSKFEKEGLHSFGLDGQMVLFHKDQNNDGVFDEGTDELYVIAGMRRGGRGYYVFEIQGFDSPNDFKVKSRISPWQYTQANLSAQVLGLPESNMAENPSFRDLGQTWSKPVIARMRHPDTPTESQYVMVFGGGYDPKLDAKNEPEGGSDVLKGNDIFITDFDGKRLNRSLASAYHYISDGKRGIISSIPSEVKVLDMDGDGFHDRIYAVDVEGHLYRIDFPGGYYTEQSNAYVIADLSSQPGLKLRQRFFNAPDIVMPYVSESVREQLNLPERPRYNSPFIIVGSGDVSNVKEDEDTPGRVYGFYDPIEYLRGDDLTVANTSRHDYSLSRHMIVPRDNLEDVTGLQSRVEYEKYEDVRGWFITLLSGQKVMSKSNTLHNVVTLATYRPAGGIVDSESKNTCEGDKAAEQLFVQGETRQYMFELFSGKPVIALNSGDTDVMTEKDRFKRLPPGGLFSQSGAVTVEANLVNSNGVTIKESGINKTVSITLNKNASGKVEISQTALKDGSDQYFRNANDKIIVFGSWTEVQ